MFVFFGFLLVFSEIRAEFARYDGYRLYSVVPKDDKQLDELRKLHDRSVFDFWRDPSRLNEAIEVLIAPTQRSQFQEILRRNNFTSRINIQDVQQLIDSDSLSERASADFNWDAYQTLSSINNWLDSLATQYPDKVSVLNIKGTVQGRIIKGVKISFGPGRKAFFIEGGIHAREWISPAVTTFITGQLLGNASSIVRTTVERYDWYIFPVFNPDGYEFTFKRNRLWRKSRQIEGILGWFCRGIDLNRNWDFHWKENGGGSGFQCSSTYAGRKPYSADEIRVMSDFIQSVKQNLTAYISYHSYGQYILIPNGFTLTPVNNSQLLMDVGKKAADSLASRYGTRYTVGNSLQLLKYVSSGTSVDWAAGVLGLPLTYTFELRDKGQYGFLLPPKFILPTAQETFEALLTITLEAINRGYA